MRINKKIVFVTILVFAVAIAYAAAASLVDQKGVLTGKVLADSLVAEGAAVKVGMPLVMIETPVGPVPATRANVNGIVKEVLVHPGDMIHTGQILVRIEQVQRK